MKGRPIVVEYEGEPRSLSEVGRMIGVPPRTLNSRYEAGKRGEDLFAPLDETRKLAVSMRRSAGSVPTDGHDEIAFLARIQLGKVRPMVVRISGKAVQLHDYHKRRARVVSRETRAWWFTAKRTSLGKELSPPGAAAIAPTETAAIAAAMALMSEYLAARSSRR